MEGELEKLLIEEDYYTFLNIPKTATSEEITSAYRRLSLMYHPDKHASVDLKSKAEVIFNKTKRAYEVLSDPHKRAIYDNLGIKGLETEGWEVIQRTKTPAEIREEYEKLAREREEQRLLKCTNPHGTTTISINATELFNRYTEYDYDLGLSLIEVTGISMIHSIEAPINSKDTVTLMSNISTKNGRGSGSVNVSCRRITSDKGWADLEMGMGDGPTISLTGFRTIARTFFVTGSGILQFSPHGFHPGFTSTVGTQFGSNTVGYLIYRGGANSSMTTMIVHESENFRANVSLQFGIPHSFILASYSYKMLKGEMNVMSSLKIGTFGFVAEYGAEKRISQHSALSASVMFGNLTGVTLKIRLTRGSQSFVVPINLCEEILMAPIFYATFLPIVSWLTVKKLIIEPISQEKEKKEKSKNLESNKLKIQEMRRQALWSVDLMQQMYRRIKNEEELCNGLLIVRAMYGQLPSGMDQHIFSVEDFDDPSFSNVMDVTIAVQCLVKNSKLNLQESSKSQLPGFYDVCIGEQKHLTIHYSFQGKLYICTLSDDEAVSLP